jgi:hypothetical protein
MRALRWIAGLGTGAALAVCVAVPALQAREAPSDARKALQSRDSAAGALSAFTPAAADPRLAALIARSGLSTDSSFRFTPAESKKGGLRAVTVAVRARTNQVRDGERALPQALSLAPIAYNLGVSVGWKRFAVTSDMTKVDIAGQATSREAMDLGVSYSGKKLSGRIKAATEHPLANAPHLIADVPNYSIDVGGSYSVSRNFALTAGVRYKSEQERLLPLRNETDNRRDSQAVYVGTAFRF